MESLKVGFAVSSLILVTTLLYRSWTIVEFKLSFFSPLVVETGVHSSFNLAISFWWSVYS